MWKKNQQPNYYYYTVEQGTAPLYFAQNSFDVEKDVYNWNLIVWLYQDSGVAKNSNDRHMCLVTPYLKLKNS